MDRRSRIAAAVARSFILVRASSNMCRETRRAVDAVQRCFREHAPQSFALARWMIDLSFLSRALRFNVFSSGERYVSDPVDAEGVAMEEGAVAMWVPGARNENAR